MAGCSNKSYSSKFFNRDPALQRQAALRRAERTYWGRVHFVGVARCPGTLLGIGTTITSMISLVNSSNHSVALRHCAARRPSDPRRGRLHRHRSPIEGGQWTAMQPHAQEQSALWPLPAWHRSHSTQLQQGDQPHSVGSLQQGSRSRCHRATEECNPLSPAFDVAAARPCSPGDATGSDPGMQGYKAADRSGTPSRRPSPTQSWHQW